LVAGNNLTATDGSPTLRAKPTYGLCSRRGVLPLSFTLDHTGPMARTAQDCAMLLQAMAGYDPQDMMRASAA
jgi:aspartyl-tRNA(Asn)/glutamyl-tRNA(Gln) amidotransferase subunit A